VTKDELFEVGLEHITNWCRANGVAPPRVETHTGAPDFGVCAYYRDGVIHIWIKSCAALGRTGRIWSWPGYVVDRTPYGVLAHELGHHVDWQHGPRGGYRSHVWRPLDAKPLTGYCPNDNEWFAELFRLFVTNPDLFAHVRPQLADLFFGEWHYKVELRPWRAVLAGSPRHVAAAENKIKAARKAAA
jgi:hypothetical protein